MDRNTDLAVNESERMRLTALRVIARKQHNWKGFWHVQAASFERRRDLTDWEDAREAV